MAAYKKAKDPFESALAAEGVTGRAADFVRSIYQQESGGGRNTKTSNAGAVGGMQIIPTTFAEVADRGWSINDPLQNARAGIRYALKGLDAAGGDPALAGAFYYGGPGGLEKARRGVAVSDPRNPSAPTTLQYGQQVAARLPKERGLVQRAVEAVIPSAQAAEQESPFSKMSDAELIAAYEQASLPRVEVRGTQADEPGVGTRVLRAVGSALGPGQVVADAVTGGRFSRDMAAGLVRGAGSIGATIARPFESADENAQRRAAMDATLADAGADTSSAAYGGGKLAAEIAGTSGVGSALAAPIRVAGRLAPAAAPAANRLAAAVASGGMSVGQGGGPVTNALLRVAGGAATGGASAGLVDPNSAGAGAAIGAVLPPAAQVVAAGGRAIGGIVRPFTAGGQERIVGDALRRFASDPDAARGALGAASEVVPGSAPTAVTAAGDDGLAALSRAMQNASPEYAANLSARQTAQNQARTAALEEVAGNTGKIDIAKQARDQLTGPMRERVLAEAGAVPADDILRQIDRQIANPNNAGRLSQQALTEFRSRIAQFTQDGAIDARALYAIRKDINDVLGGRLQGEAGNMRYASGQLTGVKGIIDDAIDAASRRATAGGTEVSTVVRPGQVGLQTGGVTGDAARPTWRGYLETYARESIPIKQMEQLDEILKSVQTGTVDAQGGAILSAAKLNNVLKNRGADLAKELSSEQLDILRRVQADLNATQLANNAGRAVGSNTVQNLAQNQLLSGVLGARLGGSTPVTSTLGRVLQLPYGTANRQIQEKLGQALLEPEMAARLLTDQGQNPLLRLAGEPALQLGYRAAPLLAAQ
ncbi:hypothetical protein A8M77_15490 [Variovorax sp. JS1663]|nr:hypothetical protein A8M77_15490 [Variovorax sp. JS1663]